MTTITLDNILKIPPNVGLADEMAFGLKVTAKRTSPAAMHDSDMIIVIDTPITQATTKDQASDSLKVKWESVASILGTSYNNGEYDLRYRKSSEMVGYSKSPRTDDYFDVPNAPEPNVSSPHTIRSLTSNAVYGIQLVYRAPGPSTSNPDDDIWVFAARHAYAWVSDQPVQNRSILAGVPVTSRVHGTTHRYKICTSTFDLGGRTGRWVSLITDAFAQWQAAVTMDLITIEPSIYPCTDYHAVASMIVDRHMELLMNPELIVYTGDEVLDLIEDFIQTTDQQQVAPWNLPGIAEDVAALLRGDKADNEIKMFNDLNGVEGYLYTQDVFTEIASNIGQRTDCWYLSTGKDPNTQRVIWTEDPTTLMCYMSHRVPEYSTEGSFLGNRHVSGDIFIRRSKFTSDLLLPREADSMFNECGNRSDDKNSAYKSFVHEVGHALGIGGAAGGHSVNEVASVVNNRLEPDCAPHPADIMALYALYQTR